MSESTMDTYAAGPPEKSRIIIIDFTRGFCILLVIAYHFGFDLVLYGLVPQWLLYNPLLAVLQPFFAGVFIFVSGVSSRFTRSNIKRGLIALLFAVDVSIVSYLAGETILFGILHFIGAATIIYGLGRRLFDRLDGAYMPVVCGVLFAALYYILLFNTYNINGLWILGITPPGFVSSDYFPIFPWVFLFLAGTWFGRLVLDRRLPPWFYSFNAPFFPVIGRYTLIIYLLHQPVSMIIIQIILKIREMSA